MASRKEEKERLRQERLANEAASSERKAKQAKARKLAAVVGAVALVAAAAVGGVVALSGDDAAMKPGKAAAQGGWPAGEAPADVLAITDAAADDGDEAALEKAATAAACTLSENRDEGREHKDPGTKFAFDSNPPTSGDHVPTPADDGAYIKDVPTVPEFVHSLEHGRVIFQWNADKVTDEQIGAIKALYDDETYHLSIAPNGSDMPYAVAATAWNNSLTCDKFTDGTLKALRLFHLNRLDQAPENVP
ncbi:MAG: DUF3105 domain-containing protein [Solirubrobacterales bacterium]